MRFTILINQVKALEWKLNLSEAAVMSICTQLDSWAETRWLEEEVYYFASRNMITNELPLVTDKSDTVYRLLKALDEKGLIKLKKHFNRDFIKLTDKGKEWCSSEKNPGKVSELVDSPENFPTESGNISETSPENFPTYKNTNTNQTTKEEKREPPKLFPESKREEISIEERKTKFGDAIQKWKDAHAGKYPKQMYEDFLNHWAEQPNTLTTKVKKNTMRFEDEKFFDIGKRLGTWRKFVKDFEINAMWAKEPELQ